MSELAARTNLLKPSPTLAITAKAQKLKTEGRDIISFAAGEPDFDTPREIISVADEALHHGITKYTPTRGTQVLREAICAKLFRENNIQATPDQIVVSCGAKHSLFNALMATINPGDEVILIAPYWMTYADQIALAGGVPVVIHSLASNDFIVDPAEIAAASSSRTRAIILNSPNNPTGSIIPPHVLHEIANLATVNDWWIISDEIYDRLAYGAEVKSIASFGPEVAARTIHIGGCSKTYAMTGWRIGFACTTVEVANAISNLQDQVTSNPTSFAQAGAVRAFHSSEAELTPMRKEFEARRDLMFDLLTAIPGVKLNRPSGAFYCFADFREHLGKKFPDDCALANDLLERANVAVIPGSVFDGRGYLRFTYANSRENIELGIRRVANALSVTAK